MLEEKCDICIIECGLGGMDDATNIMDNKLMSIITSIGMDHVSILGNNLREITTQKCGIIPGSKRVITTSSNNDVMDIIQDRCNDSDVPLIISSVEDVLIKEKSISGLIYDDTKNDIMGLKTVMPGTYQLENSYLAVNAAIALNDLGYNIHQEHIKNGLLMARWYGRFDIVCKRPLVIADGAHNEAAAKALKESVDEYFSNYNKIYVMSVFKDKEYEKILDIMSDDGILFAGETDNERALNSKELYSIAGKYFKKCVRTQSISEALNKAIMESKSQSDSVIICFGSLSIMPQVYDYFKQNTSENRLDKIRTDNELIENMNFIDEFEKNRVFCGHDYNHLMDVARIGWIYCLENKINIDKELIYATALLHDIGRARQYLYGENHEEAGAVIAKKILNRAGFNENEITMISNAIMTHNKDNNMGELGRIISWADKKSRLCYSCKAKDNCKWTWDTMNNSIEY
jgi:dihydrofolate synthase/folylpolyglutamate synthase